MSGERSTPFRFTRGGVLWTLGAALWVHAVLHRFAPDADRVFIAAWMGFALGALPWLPAAWARGPRAVFTVLLQGGVVVALAAVLGILALDLLTNATGHAAFVHLAGFALVALAALLEQGCARRIGVLISVEWLKLRKGRLLRAGLGVAVLATLLTGWTHEPLEGESGWAVAAHSLGAGFWTAEILVLVMGATMIAGELGQGTMKMVLPHAYRRSEWVAAKACVLVIATVLFVLLVGVSGTAYGAGTLGLDDIMKVQPTGFGGDDELLLGQSAATMQSHLLDTVLSFAGSLVASALVGLLLSSLFDSLVPALSASFLVFVAVKFGDILLGLSRSILDGVYAQVPDAIREQTVRLGQGFDEGWDGTLLPDGAHLALLTGVLCVLAAMRLFAKRDLQS